MRTTDASCDDDAKESVIPKKKLRFPGSECRLIKATYTPIPHARLMLRYEPAVDSPATALLAIRRRRKLVCTHADGVAGVMQQGRIA